MKFGRSHKRVKCENEGHDVDNEHSPLSKYVKVYLYMSLTSWKSQKNVPIKILLCYHQ